MKVLVVRAHPLDSRHSRSMQMADAFVEALTASHDDAVVHEVRPYLDVVPEIDVDLLTAWRSLGAGTAFEDLPATQQAKLTLLDSYTQDFLDADLVVLANPLWNLSVPTRLKAWIDTVIVAGKTFRYTETGAPEGLVPGKKLVHLQASGSDFGLQDPAATYIKAVFSFIGCEVSQVAAGGMDHDPDRAEEIMADALSQVRELARSF
ncbi:FMN-dependent NADH-azoreductase [Kytococcus sp. Marseille-QA3725]